MCGICGILERDTGRPVDSTALRAAMRALEHRGPDDHGLHVRGPVGLGHRRLSIIDLASGHQPMCNEDGTIWIVFNGEIYNYVELRQKLERDHRFRTQSDTEVIIHLYEEMGERCLSELNGMFAFAIWDERQRRLFAARDRLGIKPFYWMIDGQRFAFASEPKALIVAGLLEPQPDPQGLEEYLNFQFCLNERTLFASLNRLEPANYLTFRPFRDTAPSIVRYWDISYELDGRHTAEYFIEELRFLLQDAVRLQLRSDVPVGAHLSGGMDSSTVVALAAAGTGSTFHTFTGGFREGPEYDETSYARLVAEHVGSAHHEVWPSARDFADSIEWLIYMMDEPAAGPGAFPQLLVSRLARDHVKVVLGGQGGDELFGGYARYLVAYLEQVLKGAIFGTNEEGKYLVTWDNIVDNLAVLRGYVPMLRRFWGDGLFEDMDRRYFRLVSRMEDAAGIITPDVWNAESEARMFAAFQGVFNDPAMKSYFNRMTNFDMKTLLPALLHVEDRTSMSVSLESRVPLLDHRIAELVTRMPPAIRFKGGDAKRVFRESVRHLLPPTVLDRRDKMGFPVPLSAWFGGELKGFISDILLSDRARQRGVYRLDGVESLLRGEGRYGRQLWGLLSLELWFRSFIDGDGRVRAASSEAKALAGGAPGVGAAVE